MGLVEAYFPCGMVVEYMLFYVKKEERCREFYIYESVATPFKLQTKSVD